MMSFVKSIFLKFSGNIYNVFTVIKLILSKLHMLFRSRHFEMVFKKAFLKIFIKINRKIPLSGPLLDKIAYL